MNRIKIIWLVLCIFVGGTCVYFGGRTAIATWNYLKIDCSTSAKIQEWKVLPQSNGKYSIQAKYQYEVEGELKEGMTTFTTPLFLNSESAISTVKSWASEKWVAWYNGNEVSDSSLEKNFPLNLFFRFFLSAGISIYFLWVKKKIINTGT